jgi:alkylation response protein AidB-like acyl-CoA dehydrogenase
VQDEVFADPDIRITVSFPTGGVAGERVDGGWRIGGRWPFNTGCAHAEWAVRSAIVEVEPGQPELGVFLVPYSEVEVADDWRTSGLAGTGSHTALGTDIFVPAERMLRFAAIRAGEHASAANAASPLYRTPMVSVILTTGSTTLPGLAKAALEVFLAKLPGKGITFTTYADGSQASIRHHQAAEAAMRIKAADHLTFELADIVDRHAATGEPYAPDEHPMLWANVAYATQLYSEAIEILRRGCGAHGILTSHPIHRIARDAEALTVHAIMAPTSGLEFYGRVLCGLPPNSPML